MATPQTETPPTAETAAADALKALAPYAAEVDVELLRKLAILAQKGVAGLTEDAAEDTTKAATALTDTAVELTKAETHPAIGKSEDGERLRQAVRKARAAVEAEYLAQVSPSAISAVLKSSPNHPHFTDHA